MQQHNLLHRAIFKIKSIVLINRRFIHNLILPVKKFTIQEPLFNTPTIAFSESNLWNPTDNHDNWILTAGKIQNLRIAAKQLHGIEVKANEIFSFWKQIGYPGVGKGYVIGREIREGCIIPSIAGGLCQLSNALYDSALKANFEIIERHRHTKIIQGSLAEQNRDATVKWNYVDLRFRSPVDFRIEIEFTLDKLIVVFKSNQVSTQPTKLNLITQAADKLNDCYSCGNTVCFQHPTTTLPQQKAAIRTFILDEQWPEYDVYLKNIAKDTDCFIVPLRCNALIRTKRYAWSIHPHSRIMTSTTKALYRAVQLRIAEKSKRNLFRANLHFDRLLAQSAARKIPIETTHLVISQNLLPFIFETGALAARTFDVLMTRLPIEKLHEKLDLAYIKHSQSPTLKDFRAPQKLIALENQALTKARKIITPHPEIADIFKNKVEQLNWHLPTMRIDKHPKANHILFPASALGRKGAYEMKKLAQDLNLSFVISGKAEETKDFWEDVHATQFDGNLAAIGLVIYPTYIEHQPRQLLKAIANGIPVITTTAAGLGNFAGVTIVNIGDFEQLKQAVQQYKIRSSY